MLKGVVLAVSAGVCDVGRFVFKFGLHLGAGIAGW